MAGNYEQTERPRTLTDPESSSRAARKIEPQIQTGSAAAGAIAR
jgi:hypothetical protein